MQPKGIIKMILFATYACVSKGSGDTLPIWSSQWRPVGGSQALQHYKQKQRVEKNPNNNPVSMRLAQGHQRSTGQDCCLGLKLH